ncbi:hypothetical protein D9758_005195 [Tetrapyrgos nigripes]|uniref:Uncharacterized protein n=1 Tax=Tetrapyrgos nigripes TaxID=182062 RepID=A0A8H5GXI5_9AGAR|nr:hypothetical protein D9758_005195 [Tetrapyrgos nigripes]
MPSISHQQQNLDSAKSVSGSPTQSTTTLNHPANANDAYNRPVYAHSSLLGHVQSQLGGGNHQRGASESRVHTSQPYGWASTMTATSMAGRTIPIPAATLAQCGSHITSKMTASMNTNTSSACLIQIQNTPISKRAGSTTIRFSGRHLQPDIFNYDSQTASAVSGGRPYQLSFPTSSDSGMANTNASYHSSQLYSYNSSVTPLPAPQTPTNPSPGNLSYPHTQNSRIQRPQGSSPGYQCEYNPDYSCAVTSSSALQQDQQWRHNGYIDPASAGVFPSSNWRASSNSSSLANALGPATVSVPLPASVNTNVVASAYKSGASKKSGSSPSTPAIHSLPSIAQSFRTSNSPSASAFQAGYTPTSSSPLGQYTLCPFAISLANAIRTMIISFKTSFPRSQIPSPHSPVPTLFKSDAERISVISYFNYLVQQWGSIADFNTFADVPGTQLRVLKLSPHHHALRPYLCKPRLEFGLIPVPLPLKTANLNSKRAPDLEGWVVLLVPQEFGRYRRLEHEDELLEILGRVMANAEKRHAEEEHYRSQRQSQRHSQPRSTSNSSKSHRYTHSDPHPHQNPNSNLPRHVNGDPYPPLHPYSRERQEERRPWGVEVESLHYNYPQGQLQPQHQHHYPQQHQRQNPHAPHLPPISTLPFPGAQGDQNHPGQHCSPSSASSSSSRSGSFSLRSVSSWGSSPPSSTSTSFTSASASSPTYPVYPKPPTHVTVDVVVKEEDDSEMSLLYPESPIIKGEQEEVQPLPPSQQGQGHARPRTSSPGVVDAVAQPEPQPIPMAAPVPSRPLSLPSLNSLSEHQLQLPSRPFMLSPFSPITPCGPSAPETQDQEQAPAHASTFTPEARGKKRPLQDIGNFDDDEEAGDVDGQNAVRSEGRESTSAPSSSKRSRLAISALTEPESESMMTTTARAGRVSPERPIRQTKMNLAGRKHLAVDLLCALRKRSASVSVSHSGDGDEGSDEEDDVPLYIRAKKSRMLGNSKAKAAGRSRARSARA